jgi:hypothetical protein
MKQLFLLLCLSLAFISFSQTTFKAHIKDLHFMAGKWSMQHQWGDMEENWSAPMGDNMVCSYRCVKDGKIVFYEFIVIEQSDSVPVMKLRHFSPGSIGWEDKNNPYAYPLVQLSASTAVFQRPDKKLKMTFTRKSPEALSVNLEKEEKDGKWSKDVFDYSLKQ